MSHKFVKDTNTVDSRNLDFAFFEYPFISNRKSGPCFNLEILQQVTKYCGKEEQFLLFPTIFSIYL